VRREWIADFGDWADDDVEKTGWQSGLFIDLRNEESTSDGCIFRRLDDDRISQGQCGANRTVRQIQGEVPWAEVIRDRKTNELWTVDPWTHEGSEVPDIFPLAKWKAGE
jgi:hypothetical protein